MDKKKLHESPPEFPKPVKIPETTAPLDPEEPLQMPPEIEPELVPDEDPFETPPYEFPPYGEGP